MIKYMFLAFLLSLSMIPNAIQAGQPANELGICLTDSLTGKERKMLAKWIFFAMSEHPELRAHLRASHQAKDEVNRFVGQLITRLLADDCPRQTKAALQADGDMALRAAFELVGKVAMQELMTNQDVAASMSSFQKYLDKERLNFLNK